MAAALGADFIAHRTPPRDEWVASQLSAMEELETSMVKLVHRLESFTDYKDSFVNIVLKLDEDQRTKASKT